MITNVHVIARNDEQVKYLNELWLNSDFEINRKSACKSGFIGCVSHYPIIAYMGIDNLRFSWDYVENRTRNTGVDIEFDEYKRRMDARKKPTRTEYVKVEESIFNLKAEFEAGELYYSEFSMGKKFVQIGAEAEHLLMGNLSSGNLYRKVYRKVTWQDEIGEEFPLHFGSGKVSMTRLFSDEELKEMCHKVYHLTK